jgi:glycosyltransferase involved in cell wall biosynthesis
MPLESQEPYLQVIVPARNEQESLGRCLDSLVSQKGIAFEVMVVDDCSTDRTRAIAESFAGVRVISSTEPAQGITGKCNALMTAAAQAHAKWLLFTDADTFHYPGSLAAAVKEAEDRNVDLLSYSPEQETDSWSEQALMPVVFAELVRKYPPEKVNDPVSATVAANGQYLLVRREVYEKLGGHCAVSTRVLEDVELARLFKSAGRKIWFRHGAGMIKTRMYRSGAAMIEGWTKNLALLFDHPVRLAAMRLLEFVTITGFLLSAVILAAQHDSRAVLACVAIGGTAYLNFLLRIRRAHSPWSANVVSILGLPFFVLLLLRSTIHSRLRGAVTWKGRRYTHCEPATVVDSSIQEGNSFKG